MTDNNTVTSSDCGTRQPDVPALLREARAVIDGIDGLVGPVQRSALREMREVYSAIQFEIAIKDIAGERSLTVHAAAPNGMRVLVLLVQPGRTV